MSPPAPYHLLIETPDGNLSQGIRQLNGVYIQLLNRKRHHVGHVLQERDTAILGRRKGIGSL